MVALHAVSSTGGWQVVEDALNDLHLTFRATQLHAMGIGSMEMIEKAVERAISVCTSNGILIEEHFKTVYIADNDSHCLSKDWKLSRLAYTLVLINAESSSPLVGRMQLELLNCYLQQFEEEQE